MQKSPSGAALAEVQISIELYKRINSQGKILTISGGFIFSSSEEFCSIGLLARGHLVSELALQHLSLAEKALGTFFLIYMLGLSSMH